MHMEPCMRSKEVNTSNVESKMVSWLESAEREKKSPLLPQGGSISMAAASVEVEEEQSTQDNRRRKRGRYYRYDPEVRAKIAKHEKTLNLMGV